MTHTSFLKKYFKAITLLAVILLILFLSLLVFGENGWHSYSKMRNELALLKKKNHKLEVENKRLYRIIHRLKTDPQFQEYIIRKELKMIRKGELIFKLPEENKYDNQEPR